MALYLVLEQPVVEGATGRDAPVDVAYNARPPRRGRSRGHRADGRARGADGGLPHPVATHVGARVSYKSPG